MIIIPGGKPKIWDTDKSHGPALASQAYTGTFHSLCKQYALQQDQTDYLILSPYYGFIHPDSILPHTYNVRFTQNGPTAETISLTLLKKQWSSLNASENEPIVVLGGNKFITLFNLITDHPYLFEFPLVGLGGIGYMQKALKEALMTHTILQKK
ncbi:DUF6884 domain-containing protein [Lacticigenium naphthae]|uniref:DUF6884 domain-containing protein n=1 Tax=Lacticigenium naphthae TaxID=515351 RepID=UPI00040B1A09|nr:DUF6884 domain-containing protein [Lacticigenium naphthae]